MWEEQSMGSQTLEIIRQGVWASITGGWFYDPSQNLFCNTFHLYTWLFLLCVPFTLYVYFPPTKIVWYIYCILVTLALSGIKFGNYFLHHIYDTTECVTETIEEDPDLRREDEGIELQDLSNKGAKIIRFGHVSMVTRTDEAIELQEISTKSNNEQIEQSTGLATLVTLSENRVQPSTDSLESSDLQQFEASGATNIVSTIDLKADVHRKNSTASSESSEHKRSEDVLSGVEQKVQLSNHVEVLPEATTSISVVNEKDAASLKRLDTQGSIESQDKTSNFNLEQRPSLHSVDSEHNPSTNVENSGRRHSNITNCSLNFLPIAVHSEIKPTGSLELGYIDKNPNQALNFEGFYFKPTNRDVRRFRSAALETCCPPPTISANTNSLEVIGCKQSNKNPLPPPSTSLTRNQHLNLCQYYGSEIVYPIAEQSDEHQTSHGPDTDIESLAQGSDSDFEDTNQGSHSPLLYIKFDKIKKSKPRKQRGVAPIEGDNCAFGVTQTAQESHEDSQLDYATDNDVSEKKSSEYSNFSNFSNLSCSSDDFQESMKLKMADLDVAEFGEDERVGEATGITTGSLSTLKNSSGKGDTTDCPHKSTPVITRKKNVKKYRRRKSDTVGGGAATSSSMTQFDLGWLFEGGESTTGANKLINRKEPLKKDNEWSSTTTVSLEQDVSKVLQETVPAVRSLGAIPKKLSQKDVERKTPKSESEKCKACSRCKSDPEKSKSLKENKVTQTTRLKGISPSTSYEDLEDDPGKKERREKADLPRKDPLKHQQEHMKSEEASSSGSNNELSTLLPPAPPLLSAFLNPRRDLLTASWVSENSPRSSQRTRLKRARANIKGNRERTAKKENAIAMSLSSGQGTHTAKNFNDTSDGAVHCFMDEHGNWVTYTFDEKGGAQATTNIDPLGIHNFQERRPKKQRPEGENQASKAQNDNSEIWDSNDSIEASSVSTVMGSRNNSRPSIGQESVQLRDPTRHEFREALARNFFRHAQNWEAMPRRRRHTTAQEDVTLSALRDIATAANPENPEIIMLGSREGGNGTPTRTQLRFIKVSNQGNKVRTKSYYKIKLLPWKLTLDRLGLLAMLDRNLTVAETVLTVILGVLVSVLGAALLYLNFYQDMLAFLFCFIMASAQYSLLKSVQPDAASPTHGFNRMIAYSRPIYFCLFSSIILIMHFNITGDSPQLILARDFLIMFILFFPLLFSLGLFPQINTFILYLLEQADIHLFGGKAMCNLIGAFYCVFRSVCSALILSGLAYAGLSEKKKSQDIFFSVFVACLVALSYHLSRSASDPVHTFNLIKKHMWSPDLYMERELKRHEDDGEKNVENGSENVTINDDKEQPSQKDHVDPLPKKLQDTVNNRLKNDLILCTVIAILVFSLHASTIFTVLQPELCPVLWSIAAGTGLILHYAIPELRKQLPWLCISRPLLRSHEYFQYQIRGPAKIMWFEVLYVYLCFFERNILYPLLTLAVLTEDSLKNADRYGTLAAAFIASICGMKLLRNNYSDQNCQYLIVVFTALVSKFDFRHLEETFLVTYFFVSIAYYKVFEFLLKIEFVITYIAPWQITWGSAFHAFAQPFSVPHSVMLFSQAAISSLFSTPLNPFLGSAIFFTSYVRPVKFWERDYNTRRVDHSNTALSSHLDRNLGADDNNLNSIFYEHLTRSLQHSLYGDLAMGRWGKVNQGDVFVMASDYLNCLVHIIEMGNGLVTFQVRGLEFRGTYCQQREVEAITEGVEENEGFLCFDAGHIPNMLSVNAAFSQRWLAWEVTAAKYILEGYSISDNSVVSMLQFFEFRKVLVSYYVKSIIFYTIRSPKLEEWLNSDVINKTLRTIWKPNFVDLDPVFSINIDEDYDNQHNGMTKSMFLHVYGEWIHYCLEKRGSVTKKQRVILLCFALSLLGRRTLGAVSQNMVSSVEFFLYGLHALFKGDFRITCSRDEWVFTDMDLLKTVVAPAVRMSLKLHQDHFMTPDEYEIVPSLYDAICKHEQELVISHEGDPAWRNAVLSGTPSLLALRHVFDEGNDEYKIIMLNKRYLSFRIIKINRECVRGLWAGQQQELVYLRNRNPERGSIQNAKQALRNIINSSCDQPIGYPIYVSPLTTSYGDTNEQFCSLIGGAVTLKKIRNYVFNLFRRIRKRCGEGCSSGASNREEISMGHEGVYAMTPITFPSAPRRSTDSFRSAGSIGRGSSLSRTSLGGNRGSLASVGKPTSSTLVNITGLFKEKEEQRPLAPDAPSQNKNVEERLGSARETVANGDDNEFAALDRRVKIMDPNLVYDCINLGRRIDVSWPTEYMRCRGGRSYWKDWLPEAGMEGPVVHKWIPCHRDTNKRSHVDRTILLVQIDDKFVPIAESGVQDLGPEV
ncbi:pecanex-like protein 1 isoform X2 [Anthonomus grandis grandis]|uniref:pecanex-like protein 1 isoform X2 n=1 Tax=Anthonomus grandis grandis TaxID=2921223 RepID=UPI00216506B5|nr:pecanex-like protein 1 isoform X2 [Anthonomus grandis grandis]